MARHYDAAQAGGDDRRTGADAASPEPALHEQIVVSRLLDGDLDPQARLAAEAAMRRQPALERLFDDLQSLDDRLRRQPDWQQLDDASMHTMTAHVMSAVRHEAAYGLAPARIGSAGPVGVWWGLSAAAALAVGVGVGVLVVGTSQTPGPIGPEEILVEAVRPADPLTGSVDVHLDSQIASSEQVGSVDVSGPEGDAPPSSAKDVVAVSSSGPDYGELAAKSMSADEPESTTVTSASVQQ